MARNTPVLTVETARTCPASARVPGCRVGGGRRRAHKEPVGRLGEQRRVKPFARSPEAALDAVFGHQPLAWLARVLAAAAGVVKQLAWSAASPDRRGARRIEHDAT